MCNYRAYVARHEHLPYISLRWSMWLSRSWTKVVMMCYRAVCARRTSICFTLHFFKNLIQSDQWSVKVSTYLRPAALTGRPCWTRRALCTLREGTGILLCQPGRHRLDPSRCSGGTRTGSCVEPSTTAAPGRNPASRAARSARCRSPCLWLKTPAGSENPWWPRWSFQPQGGKVSSPRRQVRIVRSFLGLFSCVCVCVCLLLNCKAAVLSSPHSLELAFPNSLNAAAGLSTVAAPNPTRARNYRARRAEPSLLLIGSHARSLPLPRGQDSADCRLSGSLLLPTETSSKPLLGPAPERINSWQARKVFQLTFAFQHIL